MKKSISAFAFLFVLLLSPAFPQAAKDETISLPDIQAEAEKVAPETVKAPAPQAPEVPFTANVKPPLPGLDAIKISTEILMPKTSGKDLRQEKPPSAGGSSAASLVPGKTTPPQGDGSAGNGPNPDDYVGSWSLSGEKPEGGPALYAEARGGIGSMNRLLFAALVTRITANSLFSLSASHDESEGYQWNPLGTGYGGAVSSLAGKLALSFPGAKFEGKLAYADRTEGLQGRSSDFLELRARDLGGSISLQFAPVGKYFAFAGALGANLYGLAETRLLASSASPNTKTELRISPEVRAVFDSDYIDLVAEADGAFKLFLETSPPNPLNRIQGKLRLAWDPIEYFGLGLEGGTVFQPGIDIPLLFEFELRGTIPQVATIRAFGGRYSKEETLAEISRSCIFHSSSDALTDSLAWRASLETEFFFIPGFGFSAKGYWVNSGNWLIPGSQDPTTGLIQLERGVYNGLRSEAGIVYRQNQGISVSLGWNSRWFDLLPEESPHELYLEADLRSSDGFSGANFRTDWAYSSSSLILPTIAVSGNIKVTEELGLTVRFDDCLAPLMQGGRVWAGSYIRPGFRAALEAKISF